MLTNQTIGWNKFTHLMNLSILFQGNFIALLKSQVHPAVKRSCGGNTDATKHHCACGRNLCLEHTDLSYIADVTDQLSVGETRYMVCQHNYPLARDGQLSADENNMSGHEIDTAHLENLASEVRYR